MSKNEQQFSADWLGRKLTLKTGRLAKQANSAVTVQYSDTVVLATAVMGVMTVDFFWIIWGGLILLLRFRHPPTLQEKLGLGPLRGALAVFALLLFLGTFTVIRMQIF